MTTDAVQDVRIGAVETKIVKHDEMLEKMATAQTDMMISIAELNAQITTAITVLRKGGMILIGVLGLTLGVDMTGLTI
tara:strand:- start:22315 stop:22548 length:234 start_codon:yes stop_codon:yes gene_type:complete